MTIFPYKSRFKYPINKNNLLFFNSFEEFEQKKCLVSADVLINKDIILNLDTIDMNGAEIGWLKKPWNKNEMFTEKVFDFKFCLKNVEAHLICITTLLYYGKQQNIFEFYRYVFFHYFCIEILLPPKIENFKDNNLQKQLILNIKQKVYGFFIHEKFKKSQIKEILMDCVKLLESDEIMKSYITLFSERISRYLREFCNYAEIFFAKNITLSASKPIIPELQYPFKMRIQYPIMNNALYFYSLNAVLTFLYKRKYNLNLVDIMFQIENKLIEDQIKFPEKHFMVFLEIKDQDIIYNIIFYNIAITTLCKYFVTENDFLFKCLWHYSIMKHFCILLDNRFINATTNKKKVYQITLNNDFILNLNLNCILKLKENIFYKLYYLCKYYEISEVELNSEFVKVIANLEEKIGDKLPKILNNFKNAKTDFFIQYKNSRDRIFFE